MHDTPLLLLGALYLLLLHIDRVLERLERQRGGAGTAAAPRLPARS